MYTASKIIPRLTAIRGVGRPLSSKLPTPRTVYDTLRPYVPGKSAQRVSQETGILEGSILKLASNELWKSAITPKDLSAEIYRMNFYPDLENSVLFKKYAEYLAKTDSIRVNPDQIAITNGSAELLVQIGKTFLNPGESILTAEDSFVMYDLAAKYMDAQIHKVPLTGSFQFDLDRMLDSIRLNTRIIMIANPNNPTGTIVSSKDLKEFLRKIPENILVVLDEAYHGLVQSPDYETAAHCLDEFPNNLIVSRTFSKSMGMGGFRTGFGIGPTRLINEIKKGLTPFSVNNLTIKAIEIATGRPEFTLEASKLIQAEKKYLYQELDRLGLKYIPSYSNFICIFTPESSLSFAKKLEELGVIVRPQGGNLANAIRVTISLPEHNQRFIAALQQVI